MSGVSGWVGSKGSWKGLIAMSVVRCVFVCVCVGGGGGFINALLLYEASVLVFLAGPGVS